MALHIRTLSFPVQFDPGADNKQYLMLKAPTADQGGKIRVVAAQAVNAAATTGGNGFSVALHKYSNAGTPALNGTIAASVGGTLDHWGANVPKAMTLGADVLVSEGEWLVLQYNETGTGAPTGMIVDVKYLVGN